MQKFSKKEGGSLIPECSPAAQVGSYLNGVDTRPDSMALYFYLTSGPNDDSLKWPCPWHQATMSLMDQQSDVRTRMNNQRLVTTDPSKMDGEARRPRLARLVLEQVNSVC